MRVKALPRNAKSKIGPDGGYDSVDFGHSEVIRTLPDVFRAKEFSPHVGRLLSNRSSMSLLLSLATAHTGEYEVLVPLAVHVLSLMVLKGS